MEGEKVGTNAAGGSHRWGLFFGGAVIAAVLVARLLLEKLGYVAACPFRALTGVPCPTCFGLRAFAALGRGDVAGAFAANPLFAGAALALVLWGVADVFRLATRRGAAARAGRPRRALARTARWAIPIAIAANWIYLAWPK